MSTDSINIAILIAILMYIYIYIYIGIVSAKLLTQKGSVVLGCSTLVLEYAHSQDNAGQIIFLKNVLMGIRLPPPQALLFSGKFMGRRYAAGKVGVSGLDGRNCGFLNILQLNRYPMH